MNRIQYWILTGLSGLLVVLLIAHIFLVRQTNLYQATLSQAQLVVNQGQASKSILEQVAARVYKDSAKSPALKDLMIRQQITVTENTNSTENPAPPATTPVR